MENKTESSNFLNTSQELKNKAREELNKQLQGLLNDVPLDNPTDENIEDEVNRLMKEVDLYEQNYVPKNLDSNAFNDLKKFEEEFGQEEIEEPENEEDEEEEISKLNNINENFKEIDDKTLKKEKTIQNDKKNIIDKAIKNEELKGKKIKNEELKDKKNNKINNKKNINKNIIEDKEIKQLLDEYEKQLNIEVEREVEREFKPKMDENDIKRADILLKHDPLIHEALIQGIITKEELILFIDYYEIFSITNKAKKVTIEHLKALDDLCLKDQNNEKEVKLKEKKDSQNSYDLNDKDAINKLTQEIEKKLESSENIFTKKLEYEKIMKNPNISEDVKKKIFNQINKEKKDNNEDSDKDRKNILDKKNNNINKKGDNKDSLNFDSKITFIKNNINEDDRRLSRTESEISNFTTDELMSVPKYSLFNNKKVNNNNNSDNSKISNKTFYEKSQKSGNNSKENEIYKPKTPLNPLSKDKSKTNRNKNSNYPNQNISNSFVSHNSGKKIIPPIKNIKPKTNKRELFDDNGNPLIIGKNRDARKEMIKMKMGGKSRMHELFTNKPRNMEENEKLRQKFIDFIQTGKENNKNSDTNTLKKSIVRKKIEDAQMFNKYKK